jgi:dTDP-4-dehydrorhamnose 3,5-epimerase-like enzyme
VIDGVQILEIPLTIDPRGSLGVLEFENLKFVPKRLYWLSNVPRDSTRGNHAHKTLNQIFILLSGSIDIEIYRGRESETFSLKNEGSALSLTPGLWRNIKNASVDAVLVVVCDQPYDEEDYLREFNQYLDWFYAT